MRLLSFALLAVLAGWGCGSKSPRNISPTPGQDGPEKKAPARDWAAELSGNDPAKWKEAANALARENNSAALVKNLRSDNLTKRQVVSHALKGTRPTAQATAEMSAVLEEWTIEMRKNGRIKPRPADKEGLSLSGSTRWIQSEDPDLYACKNLVEALGGLGPAGAVAVPVFQDMLRDADNIMRPVVLKAAANLGPKAAPLLADALRDWTYRQDMEEGLAKMGAGAVPALVGALKGSNRDVRMSACQVLQKIGPPAQAAGPALLDVLRGPDDTVGWLAVGALGKVRPAASEVVPVLSEALRHKSPEVCWRAAEVLAEYGPAAKGAVPALMAALKRPQHLSGVIDNFFETEEASLHEVLIVALGKIGPAAREAIPTLQPFRKAPEARVRKATEAALKTIGGK